MAVIRNLIGLLNFPFYIDVSHMKFKTGYITILCFFIHYELETLSRSVQNFLSGCENFRKMEITLIEVLDKRRPQIYVISSL